MEKTLTSPVFAAVTGLPQHGNTLTRSEAAHLLRRSILGPNKSEIDQAAASGLSWTLNRLFLPPTLPDPPVNHFFPDDPNVPIGATWVESPHLENGDVGQYRWPSLRGWYFNNLMDADFSITERMALFWMNHFGMSDVGEHRAQYQYLQLFRQWGAGNFQRIIEEITVHPAMLRFLNGDYSTRWEPNENYARELLELFTIQKGPQVSPGDYTHYTEEDIQAAARILTGWRNRGMWSQQQEPVESYFFENWHDEGEKTFSHRFDNQTISGNGDQEYKDLIAMIFSRDEVSRAICRELYRYFVYYDIDSSIESDVIEPLAQCLRDNNYELEPVLRNLLGSQHFFDMSNRGPMIKNPYEFMIGVVRPLGGYAHLGLNLELTYNLGGAYHWWATNQDMDFLYPPTVAGWKAYYQSPAYYRSWINSTTLQKRQEMVQAWTNNGLWAAGAPRPFDFLAFIDSLDQPAQLMPMITEITEIFLSRPLVSSQIDVLTATLVDGLNQDTEWTNQYLDYRANPNNPDIVIPITNKVKMLFRTLFSLAEFHLQ